jgi:arsenate reductase (glutaredoxin)
MMMIQIYHNPRCTKSRAGLKYLQQKGVEFELLEYVKSGISEKELKTILTKLNMEPLDLIRTQEEKYRKEFRGKNFTREEWIKIMAENPALIKRPVIVTDYKAVWADPPEEMDILFK